MPGDKDRKLLQTCRGSDKKNKKTKKRKKPIASIAPPPDKPQVVPMPPETSPASMLPPVSSCQSQVQLPKFRAAGSKDGKRLTGSGRRSKKSSQDSPPLPTAASKASGNGAPSLGCVKDLDARARESLRWEGELEDPQAEEKRLELYRTNRRLRYISQREAPFKESQCAL